MNRLAIIVSGVILSGIVATTNAEAKMQNLQMDESVWSITDKYDRTIENIEKMSAENTALITPDPKLEVLVNGKYKVIKGDTVSEVAKKCDVSVRQIHHLNNISREQQLTAGQTLQINEIQSGN
ncbi:LysM peptidoglycan-binding domain-containing protein [Macrococcus carouselicus]|uniref:LysM domain-containing protein n=1 Tax=Macrococcus carouselicus TaxID=69969 RepID=A0A9Q8CCE3_9STAP|nr:LysM domain-containing protein [Macrococcus carouselicus]TDL95386.1 LysM domain-containing protein [Macrococcus carouselicus]